MIARVKSLIRNIVARLRNAAGEPQAPGSLFESKFEQRAPAHTNAIDIFSGHWATDLSKLNAEWHGGAADLANDSRPVLAAQTLGAADRVDGMTILELGPLEGLHTHRFEQLGAARILAVESNVEAYLKCLVMKEALGMKRAEFLLGDFNLYLQGGSTRFDMVFACGVLYHMEDPLALIRGIANATDRCFVWTHYFDEGRTAPRVAVPASLDGLNSTYYRAQYQDRAQPGFWGGNKPSANWMKRDDILAAFRHFGLNEIEVVGEDPNALHGPTITFAARRRKN
jgi:hypothetical protein